MGMRTGRSHGKRQKVDSCIDSGLAEHVLGADSGVTVKAHWCALNGAAPPGRRHPKIISPRTRCSRRHAYKRPKSYIYLSMRHTFTYWPIQGDDGSGTTASSSYTCAAWRRVYGLPDATPGSGPTGDQRHQLGARQRHSWSSRFIAIWRACGRIGGRGIGGVLPVPVRESDGESARRRRLATPITMIRHRSGSGRPPWSPQK